MYIRTSTNSPINIYAVSGRDESEKITNIASSVLHQIFNEIFDVSITQSMKNTNYFSSVDMDELIQRIQDTKVSNFNIGLSRLPLYNKNGFEPSKSIMFAFNQVLASYLQTLTDKSTGYKLYNGLISNFVNGVGARTVNSVTGETFPDLIIQGSDFGNRGDPVHDKVILQSLGLVLQRLTKDSKLNISDHLIMTLLDVPLYMKELYRSNLPIYIKLFDLLLQKISMLKELISKVIPEQVGRPNVIKTMTTSNKLHYHGVNISSNTKILSTYFGGTVNFHVHDDVVDNELFIGNSLSALTSLNDCQDDSKQYKNYLTNLLDSLNVSINSIMGCAIDTLKELNDQPNYMQISEGSLEAYQSRNGQLPFAPLSLLGKVFTKLDISAERNGSNILLPVNTLSSEIAKRYPIAVPNQKHCNFIEKLSQDGSSRSNNLVSPNSPAFMQGAMSPQMYNEVNDMTLMPAQNAGTDDFKFKYATRGILLAKSHLTFDNMKTVKKLLLSHNNMFTKKDQLDEENYLKFSNDLINVIRYTAEARNYKSQLSYKTVPYESHYYIDDGKFNNIQRKSVIGIAESSVQIKSTLLKNTPDTFNKAYDKDLIKFDNKLYPLSLFKVNLNDYSELMQIVNDSNQNIKIDEFMINIKPKDKWEASNIRQQERLYNLIDINISPINVHSLSRMMSFAYLFNYEYTFDKMISTMYGEELKSLNYRPSDLLMNGEKSIQPLADSTKKLFIQMMIDPYRKVSLSEYGSDIYSGGHNFIQRIFRGDNNLGMGRPKYLSDQIFNKALFGSIYITPKNYDEGGPISRNFDTIATKLLELTELLFDEFNNNIAGDNGNAWFFRIGKNKIKSIIDMVNSLKSSNKKTQKEFTELQQSIDVDAGDNGFYWGINTIYKKLIANGAGANNIALLGQLLIQLNVRATRSDLSISTAHILFGYAICPTADDRLVYIMATTPKKLLKIPNLIIKNTKSKIDVYVESYENLSISDINRYLNEGKNDAGVRQLLHDQKAKIDSIINPAAPSYVMKDIQNTYDEILKHPPTVKGTTYSDPNILQFRYQIKRLNNLQNSEHSYEEIKKTTYIGPASLNHSIDAYSSVIKIDDNLLPRIKGADMTKLTYINATSTGVEIISAKTSFDVADSKIIDSIGRKRFDTTLIRNLFFITNVVRVLRSKMEQELSFNRNIVVNSHAAVAKGITEYGLMPFTPNQQYDSATIRKESNFMDRDQYSEQ